MLFLLLRCTTWVCVAACLQTTGHVIGKLPFLDFVVYFGEWCRVFYRCGAMAGVATSSTALFEHIDVEVSWNGVVVRHRVLDRSAVAS